MINNQNKPLLVVIAGPNGSGKTSVTSKLLKHEWVENCEYINPDNIARDLFGDWNSPEAMLKAAQYATSERERCLLENQNLIFETVLSAPDKVLFVEQAKEKGYFIRLFFICTDNPQINCKRIAHRFMMGGHDVPFQKIISRYYKSIINCELLVPIVDRLYVYDNSIEDKNPTLLFRVSDGMLIKQYDVVRDWALNIFDTSNKQGDINV